MSNLYPAFLSAPAVQNSTTGTSNTSGSSFNTGASFTTGASNTSPTLATVAASSAHHLSNATPAFVLETPSVAYTPMYANRPQHTASAVVQTYPLALSAVTPMQDLTIDSGSPYPTALAPVHSGHAVAPARYSPVHTRGLSPVPYTNTDMQTSSPRLPMTRTVTQTSTQMQSSFPGHSQQASFPGHSQQSSYSQSMPQTIPEPSAVFTLCQFGLNCHFKDKCKSFHPEKIGVCPTYIHNSMCSSGNRCALEHPTQYGDSYVLKTGQCFRVIRSAKPARPTGPAGYVENKTAQMQPAQTAKYSVKATQNKPFKIYQSFLLDGNAVNAAIGKGIAGDTSDLLFQKSKGIDRQGKIARQKGYLIEQLQRIVQDEENLTKQMILIDSMLQMINNADVANAINQSNLGQQSQGSQPSQGTSQGFSQPSQDSAN